MTNHRTLNRRQWLTRAGIAAGGATMSSLVALSGCANTGTAEVAKVVRNGVAAAPGLGAPKFIGTNGITLGVYDQGTGFPVVLCHGFPELAYSWRHQIKALAAGGYRAIAPDQRGYGLSDRPASMDQYTVRHLCDDLAGMLDELQIERAVFCGHDWGGGVVWMMPRFHADRVAGVIGVNTPGFHPGHSRQPSESPIVRTENYYTRTFQTPGHADALLAADVRRVFELMLRRGGFWDAERFPTLPEDSAERQVDLLRMLAEANFTGEFLLTEAELAVFVDTFEATGFTGGLNWYRAAEQVPLDYSTAKWDIEAPCLYVGAEDDVILPPSSADAMAAFIDDFDRYTVANCGHWTQQEKPEEFNRVMLEWLDRKFA